MFLFLPHFSSFLPGPRRFAGSNMGAFPVSRADARAGEVPTALTRRRCWPLSWVVVTAGHREPVGFQAWLDLRDAWMGPWVGKTRTMITLG